MANPLVAVQLKKLIPIVGTLPDDQKLWLFDRAIENIGDAPVAIKQLLKEFVVHSSVECKNETDLSRWAFQRIMHRQLNPSDPPTARFGELEPLLAEVMILLSVVTHTDSDGDAAAQYNFMRAIAHTGLDKSVLVPTEQMEIADLEDAVVQLSYLSARQRRTLVMACVASIVSNRSTNLKEAWVLRAICDGFSFPMPSVLPGHELVAGV